MLRFRLVKIGVAWFQQVISKTYASGTLADSFTSTPPTSWGLGATKVYNVSVTNTGTVTWLATGTNKVQLAVYTNGTSDAVGAWSTEPTRYALPNNVAPGQSVTIPVTLTARATAGTFTLRQRMVYENGPLWFGNVQTTVCTVSQVALAAGYTVTPPTSLRANQTTNISIRLTNTGTTTWLANGTSATKLGVYFGGYSDAIGTWSVTPQLFVLPNNVAPGASVTLTVSVRAPAIVNGYILRFRMIQGASNWFDYFAKSFISIT